MLGQGGYPWHGCRGLDVPGIPQHIVTRGINRQPCFQAAADYRAYLRYLAEATGRHGCAVHAYVLMTNHVHLLLTPSRRGAVSLVMQSIGRRYVPVCCPTR